MRISGSWQRATVFRFTLGKIMEIDAIQSRLEAGDIEK